MKNIFSLVVLVAFAIVFSGCTASYQHNFLNQSSNTTYTPSRFLLVTHTSLTVDPSFKLQKKFIQAMFFGLGADGTVGANKNSIKIIANYTDNFAQGYFVYDSKKSGSMTTSHLRFGPEVINAPYLIGENEADFIACHHTPHLGLINMLKFAKTGAVFLLNTTHGPDTAWDTFPRLVQQQIIDKKIRVFVIDGYAVAEKTGMGRRLHNIAKSHFKENVLNATP
jgi:pyruvate-ferredoxin/flavodoxin oxidoreductase